MDQKSPLGESEGDSDSEPTAIAKIENAARRIVLERPDVGSGARRDVHRKHQGCVWGCFKVYADIPPALKHGVFQRETTYPVWIRFSSSSKHAQSDTEPDGRGIAIKLLEVNEGERLRTAPDAQKGTQDFVFLNGPAFFAADAASMAIVAQLDADDRFPSGFFRPKEPSRVRGAVAVGTMSATQAESPLDLTYHSQTPYQLGPDLVVKYRLKPTRAPRPRKPGPKSANHLFEALKDDLKPASDAKLPAADDLEGDVAATFVFEVLRRGDGDGFPIDDATVVWPSTDDDFIPVAELRIARQIFDTVERMTLAENMSFNPWNGLTAHRPLGSINRARLHAYEASRKTRHALNRVTEATYSKDTWRDDRKPGSTPWQPDAIPVPGPFVGGARLIASLATNPAESVARFLSSNWGLVIAPALLVILLGLGQIRDEPWYCRPVTLAPSEGYIPGVKYAKDRRGTSFETDEAERKKDIVWTFRYASVGGEALGGLPYWLFRALPRIAPSHFGERGDWSQFGFVPAADEYYEDYHELPRGLVLTDAVANFGGTQLSLALKLVTFNCATCHRGEYIDGRDSHFVDGMPNLGIDPAGFKQAVFGAIRDKRFTAENLIVAVNELLAEHKAPPLTLTEEIVYVGLARAARTNADTKTLEWMDQRPRNGFGRLDAFSALRFEYLGFPKDWPAENQEKMAIATVDLPSIWNQGKDFRPRHHWDGNTADERARNFGAIIGVGAIPESLRKAELTRIGNWLDTELKPPPYPPAWRRELDPIQVSSGQKLYEDNCAKCHGTYHEGKVSLVDCMKEPIDVGTDTHRYRAVNEPFVEKLNAFGAVGLWYGNVFEAKKGYLCPPLDGIWARAPYLHNGSVPTLDALLHEVDERPPIVWRGNPNYDRVNGGFVNEAPEGRASSSFETRGEGNSAGGHDFHIDSAGDRKALVTYLLTL